MCVCMYIYTYVCMYIRMYVCVSMYICMYVCMCMYAYLYPAYLSCYMLHSKIVSGVTLEHLKCCLSISTLLKLLRAHHVWPLKCIT